MHAINLHELNKEIELDRQLCLAMSDLLSLDSM